MGLSSLLPWQAKVAAKIVLSRVPAGYAVWRRLNLFRHGAMDDPAYAEDVFCSHLARVKERMALEDFVGLELGPGDSLLSAVIAKAYGARKTWLIDVGPYAAESVELYRAQADRLTARGLPAPDLSATETIQSVLAACNAEYCTEGLASLRAVPTGSVDFIWSQAVLEHVRRSEFAATMAETFRVLKPGGIASHRVDLRDHLGGKLNNLRFSEVWWEDDSIAKSGFYTNRIRYAEMLAEFRAQGFDVEVVDELRWEALPTPRHQMNSLFRGFADDDLNVFDFSVVLRKPLV
jgi:SAM-dependent methyltransferase